MPSWPGTSARPTTALRQIRYPPMLTANRNTKTDRETIHIGSISAAMKAMIIRPHCPALTISRGMRAVIVSLSIHSRSWVQTRKRITNGSIFHHSRYCPYGTSASAGSMELRKEGSAASDIRTPTRLRPAATRDSCTRAQRRAWRRKRGYHTPVRRPFGEPPDGRPAGGPVILSDLTPVPQRNPEPHPHPPPLTQTASPARPSRPCCAPPPPPSASAAHLPDAPPPPGAAARRSAPQPSGCIRAEAPP